MLKRAIQSALDAGGAILKIYEQDFEVEVKADESPLTAADKASHEIIVQALEETPYPVLSEESAKVAYADRKDWQVYWLVDPLDGTKEFIKKNGEFTVNIALIDDGEPVAGIVYVPVLHTLYLGVSKEGMGLEKGAWKAGGCAGRSVDEILASAKPCRVSGVPGQPLKVVASKSHCNDETRQFIAGLEDRHGAVELVSSGSSLKLCMVADGSADVYPRIAPTMEWDTAAAHAVVNAAGGRVYEFTDDLPTDAYVVGGADVHGSNDQKPCVLRYNKENLLNPYFVVSGIHE